ncbi:MAG: spermidine/putrescine ABC transporter substrate-binding protein, partial [Naasia sp.]
MPGPDVDARVSAVVDAWLVWLPRWTPSLARRGSRVCRKCLGSPVVQAAGLGEAPHKVQHALVSRVHALVDADVAAYTAAELPVLQRWLDRSDAERKAQRAYRPEEGLDHEFEGLGVDPEPVEGEPS